MYEEKEHLCTGTNCIFCRIFTAADSAELGSRALVSEQSLLKMKAMSSGEALLSQSQTNEQVDRLAMLEKLAFFDKLTGIYNAHAFMKELQEEVARAQRYKRPLSIGIISIDKFAEIKTMYGPLGAEAVLKYVAGVLKESLRGVDTAARYQGEQFAIILPETNNAGALVVAERLSKRIVKQAIKLTWQTINITVSVGIATFLKHGQGRDEMIRSALSAMVKLQAG
jgi:diguanylate cyclase (GGDEF)-like protein